MPVPSPDRYLSSQALAPLGLSSAQWERVDAQLKERAFFMAGVARADILQLFRGMAAKVAGGQMTPAEARVAIRAGLAELGYEPEKEGAAPGSIQDLSSYRRIMLVLETNVRMARGWMQHCLRLRDPNVGGQELFRLYARKVPRNWALRWAEAAQKVNWQGVAQGAPFIATLDSPIWPALSRFGNPYPPFDFNSGMSTRPVLLDRCRELGLPPKEENPVLPSLNEGTRASLASLDADLADALTRTLGGLVVREGDELRMADLNGTTKYPLQELCSLFAAKLPKGIPSLQAKAAAAWAAEPDSFLPGGKNEALLPALIAFAGRISPRPPAKLEQFLQKAGGKEHLKKDWDAGIFSREEKKRTLQDFAPQRKEKVQEIFNRMGGEIQTSLPEIPYVQLNKSGVKEMLNPKAIWASLNLGTGLGIYLEMLNDTRNLLQKGERVVKLPINDANDPLAAKIYVEAEKAASDGKVYISRYMIRIFKKKGMKPDLYFLNCRPK